MAGIDRWLHYTVTTIDRFHSIYIYIYIIYMDQAIYRLYVRKHNHRQSIVHSLINACSCCNMQ